MSNTQTSQPSFSFGAYSDLYAAFSGFLEQYLKNKLDTFMPVKVVGVGSDNSFVNVQPLLQSVKVGGEVITEAPIYYDIPVIMLMGSNIALEFMPSVGDMGFLIGGKWDMSDFKTTKQATPISSNRTFSFANGVYLPMFFANKQQGITLKNSSAVISILDNTINITADIVNVTASEVNLGGEGGAGVARLGDEVTVGSSKGTITKASSTVKAV